MLRWTDTSPWASPATVFAETRLSAHPRMRDLDAIPLAGDGDVARPSLAARLGSCFALSRQPFRAPAGLRAILRGCPEEAGSQ